MSEPEHTHVDITEGSRGPRLKECDVEKHGNIGLELYGGGCNQVTEKWGRQVR